MGRVLEFRCPEEGFDFRIDGIGLRAKSLGLSPMEFTLQGDSQLSCADLAALKGTIDPAHLAPTNQSMDVLRKSLGFRGSGVSGLGLGLTYAGYAV